MYLRRMRRSKAEKEIRQSSTFSRCRKQLRWKISDFNLTLSLSHDAAANIDADVNGLFLCICMLCMRAMTDENDSGERREKSRE